MWSIKNKCKKELTNFSNKKKYIYISGTAKGNIVYIISRLCEKGKLGCPEAHATEPFCVLKYSYVA